MEDYLKIKTTNTILYCENWGDTVSFYKSALQLPVIASNEWFVEFRLNSSARLSIADESRATIKSNYGKGLTLGLQVENIEAVRTQLIESGFSPSEIKDVWGARAIYLHDPEGNRIEFWAGQAHT